MPTLETVKDLSDEFKAFSTIKLNSSTFQIGRALKTCSLVIPSPKINKIHTLFKRSECEGKWTITDYSSAGIKVNDVKIKFNCPHWLEHDDKIQLDDSGEFIYKFILDEENEPPKKRSKITDINDDNKLTHKEAIILDDLETLKAPDVSCDDAEEKCKDEITQSEVPVKEPQPCTSASLDLIEDIKSNVTTHFCNILENELQCPICSYVLVEPVTLNCTHTFCKYCIGEWKKKKKECPICRTKITAECRSIIFDSFIDKMVDSLSADTKKRRRSVLNDRKGIGIRQMGGA